MKKSTLIRSTYFFGVFIPFAETMRRGTNFGYLPNYIDDYIIGGVLIFSAWAASSGKSYGNAMLVAAWSALCGGLYYSFTGQFQVTNDVSGLSNWFVISFKAVLYALALFHCFQSIKNVTKNH